MTIQQIPTYNYPFFSQTTTLEGTSYLLNFSYSQREDCWYMSMADANGVDIYNGMKLICSPPTGPNALLFKCRDPRRPPGDFFVLSGNQDLSPPGLNDLVLNSGRCQLYYMTSDVLALIAAGQVDTYLLQLATNTTTGTGSTYGQLTT
jgi:hypothetical protein